MGIFRILVTSCFLIYSSATFALVDGQLMYGVYNNTKEKSDTSSSDLKSSVVKAAVHLDPIPLVPVAGGLYLLYEDYGSETGSTVLNFNSFKGMQLGVEVMAWFPIKLFNLTPYGTIGYSLYGPYKLNYNTTLLGQSLAYDAVYKQTGLHINVGVKWSPIPFVAAILALDIGQTTLKQDSITYNTSVDTSTLTGDQNSYNMSSTTILIGVEAGL